MKAALLFAAVLGGAALLHAQEARRSSSLPRPGDDRMALEQGGRRIPLWYHQPPGGKADLPIVFVLHGANRDAEDYLHDWNALADEYRFVVVVPEFSQKNFPGDSGYIYGNTVDARGRPVPREQWAFSVIEPAFDAIKARLGSTRERYSIYGHSAGAQFVQRFIYFVPHARIERAVAANAGWYMLPDPAVRFPYGVGGTPVTVADLRAALALPLTVLLGTADTNAHDRVLRKTPEAEAQGPNRFARGHYFFRQSERWAAAHGFAFAWSLSTAPGIGHSDPGMAPFAARILCAPQTVNPPP